MKVINDGTLLKGKVTVALTTCTYVIVKISIPVAHDYRMWSNALGFFKYFKKNPVPGFNYRYLTTFYFFCCILN